MILSNHNISNQSRTSKTIEKSLISMVASHRMIWRAPLNTITSHAQHDRNEYKMRSY